MQNHTRSAVFFALLLFGLVIWGQTARAATQQQIKMLRGQKEVEATEEVQPLEQLSSDQIDSFMATLSDEQVRRLLIEELKKAVDDKTATTEAEKRTDRSGGLGPIFDKADREAGAIFKRIRGIFRGSAAILSQRRALIGQLSDGKGGAALLITFVGLIAVIGAGLLGERLLLRLTKDLHNQLLSTVPLQW